MKKLFFIAVFVLSMGAVKSQIFVLGDATFPSVGGMIHFQTMDVEQLGFFNYITYGNSKSKDMQSLSLAAGLSYYFSKKHQRPDPQDCFRVYGGFNYNVFWRGDDILKPIDTYEISFDIGVSKTFERFTLMIMWDILNQSVKPGASYYF